MSFDHIVLHLGAHKTASTWIQYTLSQNRQFLEEYGCCYLGGDAINKSLVVPFLWAGRVLPSSRALSDQDSIIALSRFLSETAGACRKVFFSSETALGTSGVHKNNGYLYPRAKEICGLFAGLPGRKTVYFFIRNYADFLESTYIQQVKQGETISFGDFVKHTSLEKISWVSVVSKIREVFENVHVITYEDFRANQEGVILSMLNQVGVHGSLKIEPDLVRNKSYSSRALQLGLHINEILTPEEVPLFRNFLLKNFSRDSNPLSRPKLLSEGFRSDLNRKYKKDVVEIENM